MKIDFNTCSLISFHTDHASLHIGVSPGEDSVYKYDKDGTSREVEYSWWLWGKATEPYDHILDYFGMGPFALLVLPNGYGPEYRVSWKYKILQPCSNIYNG